MGLADRDYLRSRPQNSSFGGGSLGGGAFGGRGAWSVTLWLIVICVAVFFIDRMAWKAWPATVSPFDGQVYIVDEKLAEGFDRIPKDRLVERIERMPRQPGLAERQVSYRQPNGILYPIYGEVVRLVPPIQKYLQFTTAQGFMRPSSTYGLVGFEFWRFFGYQFLHAHWLHLLLNMMGLWFFGPEVERFLGRKRFLAFYLLCGFFGAFLYMLLNGLGFALRDANGNSIAPFLPGSLWTPLIGASGSVYGVIIAGARLAPNDTVLLLGIIPMRLQTLAIFIVLSALFALFAQTQNAGGEAAHLGGAMAGFFFIRRPDLLNNFFDILGRVDPTSRSNRARRELRRAAVARTQVDAILDKVREHGIQSLTEQERQILRQASRD